jgi:WS/DGAT/MGAT family acyltransferase
MAHESVEVARHPAHMLDLATTAREDADALAKVLLQGADPQTPLKGEMGVAKSVAWSAPIPVDDVKAMGHATGTTINDILLTAMAGALRRYLRARDGLVEELTAFIPFNLRPLDEPLPAELGNRFGLVFLQLPVGIGDRRRRLRVVHERMEEIKHSPEGAVSYGVLDAMGRTPVGVEQRLVDLFSTKGSAVITNVPGPRRPVYLAGTPVAGVLVWAPASGGVSMTVSIFSYAGQITVGLMVDAGLIPDPETILTGFEREIQALLRLKRPGS